MIDCLIVGAGHSGLLSAQALHAAGLNYRIVDESDRLGDIWRRRPRSLKLFTSRQFCRLGRLAMPGDPQGFPSAREFADHLELFAKTENLSVTLGARVIQLGPDVHGYTAVLSHGETVRARCVINATGSNQEPIVPPYAAKLSPGVRQSNALDFGSIEALAPGQRIAVVGDGASGRQIARELSAKHQVALARGRVRKLVPNTVLGRDIFWWLDKLGILYAPTDSIVARLLRKRDPIPAAADNDRRLTRVGVQLRGKVVDADGATLVFADGGRQEVDMVIWCVGYRERVDWIDMPTIRQAAPFTAGRGRTPEPGFFVVGRKWLSCRASELVLGAEQDASRVAADVVAFCRQKVTTTQGSEVLANV